MDWEFPANHECCFCNTEIKNNSDFKLLTSKARIGKFLYCNILPELTVKRIIKKICLKCHDLIQTKKCEILKSGLTSDIIGKNDSDARKLKIENIRKSLLSYFPNSQFSSDFGAVSKKSFKESPCGNSRGKKRKKSDTAFSELDASISRGTNNYEKNPPSHLKNESSNTLTNEQSPKSARNSGAEKCADVSSPISRNCNYARLVISSERDTELPDGSAEDKNENAKDNCKKSSRENRLKIKDIARDPTSWCKNQTSNSRRKMISFPSFFSDNAVDGSDESFNTSLENSFSDTYISKFCEDFTKAYENDFSCDSYEILASLFSRDGNSTPPISERSEESNKRHSEMKRFWVNEVSADGMQRTGYEEIRNSKKSANLNSESCQIPSEKSESRNFLGGLFPTANSASSEKNASRENNTFRELEKWPASDETARSNYGQNLSYGDCETRIPVSNCSTPGDFSTDKSFPMLNFFTKCNIYGGDDFGLYSSNTSYSLASENTCSEFTQDLNHVIGSQRRLGPNKCATNTLESRKRLKKVGYDGNLNTPSVSPFNSCQSIDDLFINPTTSKKCYLSVPQDKIRSNEFPNDEIYCDENANYRDFQSSTNTSHTPSEMSYDFYQPTNDQPNTSQYSMNAVQQSSGFQSQYRTNTIQQSYQFQPRYNTNAILQSHDLQSQYNTNIIRQSCELQPQYNINANWQSNEFKSQYNMNTVRQSNELQSQYNMNTIWQSNERSLNISQNQPGLNLSGISDKNGANNEPSGRNFENTYSEGTLPASNPLKDICKSILFSDASVSSIVDLTDNFSEISVADFSNSNDLFVNLLAKDWSFNSEETELKGDLVEVAQTSQNKIKSEDGEFEDNKLFAEDNIWKNGILDASENNRRMNYFEGLSNDTENSSFSVNNASFLILQNASSENREKSKGYPIAPNLENANCEIEMKPTDHCIANNALREIEESDSCDNFEFKGKEIYEKPHVERFLRQARYEDCVIVSARRKNKARKAFDRTIKMEEENSRESIPTPRKRGRPKGSTNKRYLNKKKIVIADDMCCVMCQKEFNNFGDFASHCFTYHCMREDGYNERFVCPYCFKKFDDPFQFANHFGRHNFDSNFSAILFVFCPLCSLSKLELYGFKSREEFGNHVNESHRAKDENKCGLCGDAISNDLRNSNKIDHLLRKHSLTDILVKPKYIRCVLCKGQYGSQDKMCNHVCPKLVSSVCGICGVNFPSKKRLTFHSQLHHEESERIFARCEECFLFLDKEEKCYDHIRFSHEKDYYPCLFCKEVFKNRVGLVLHMKYHMGKRQFLCDECGKAFLNKTTLREHEVSHLKVKPFQCHICGGCVSRKSRLRAHIQAHVSKSSNIAQMCFMCEQCNCVHATARENAQHQRRVHEEKSKQNKIKLRKAFLCEYCEECYADAESLNAHREMQHWNTITYTCRVCRNEFATFSRLATHKLSHGLNYDKEIKFQTEAKDDNAPQKELSIPKYFCCGVCDKTFLRYTGYSFHRKNAKHAYDAKNLSYGRDDENPSLRKGDESREYGCDVCKKKFVSEKSLEKHSQMHRDGGTLQIFVCVRCGKNFRSKAAYKFHEKAHSTNTPYKCDKCGKEFFHVSGYRTHMRRHTYSGRYLCQFCGRKFDHPSERDNHLRSHTGERPYSCNECGKKFITRQTWLQHAKTHLNMRRYYCETCGKEFLRQRTLYMHERNESCSPKYYKCDNCSQRFDRKYSLQQHLESCVKDFSRMNFERDYAECPYCNMKLSLKESNNQLKVVDQHVRMYHSNLTTKF